MKYPPHEARLAATTPQADPAADAVCVCGHPKRDHMVSFGVEKFEYCRRWTSRGYCECKSFRPATRIVSYTVTSGVGAPPAHDTPAAQLRERIARLERDNQIVLKVIQERDTARAEAEALHAQLAALHPLADGYAGAMRELAELKTLTIGRRTNYESWEGGL